MAASAPGAAGKVFNIACGVASSLNDVLKLLEQVLGSKVERLYDEGRSGDVRHSLADISLAKAILKYEPTVNFVDGLRKTVDWFRRA